MKAYLILFFLLGSTLLMAQAPRLVIPTGHTNQITSVTVSRDGKYILTGSYDRTAKLWDRSGKEIQTYSGHSGIVQAVAFSNDGKTVLTGSWDHKAKLWDLSGAEIETLDGHTDFVMAVAFSPDGKKVITGSRDKTARIWDRERKTVTPLTGHSDQVGSVAWSPDGQFVLTGSMDGTAILWKINGEKIRTFSIPERKSVLQVAFTPDGANVLTGAKDYTVRLWNLNGSLITTINPGDVTQSLAISPDGKTLLTCANMTVSTRSLQGTNTRTYSGKNMGDPVPICAAFTPDGNRLLVAFIDRTVVEWTLNGKKIQTIGGHGDNVGDVAFSPDGRQVLTGATISDFVPSKKNARLWNLTQPETVTFAGHQGYVPSVAFSPNGKQALTGSWDGDAKIWDLNGKEQRSLKGHTNHISSVAWSPDGTKILTGSMDKTAKLWSADGRLIQTIPCGGMVFSAIFSPDGTQILTRSDDRVTKLWDLSGRQLRTFPHVTAVAFSPDGRQLLTGAFDGRVQLWDLYGAVIQTFSGHTGFISNVAFSPDGKRVLTGSHDGTAKLWDRATGRVIQTFSGHANFINSVAFSPACPDDPAGGRFVMTGSKDNSTKLWDTQSGKELATLFAIDSSDWAVTTPSGLFDASPGAMRQMFYLQGLEPIELEQLKSRYWEPGLLSKVLNYSKHEVRNVSGLGTLPLYPEISAVINGHNLHVDLKVRSGGMGKLILSVNGKRLMENANPNKKTSLDIDLNAFAANYLPGAANTIALRSYIDGDGWLKSQDYELTYTPGGASKGDNDVVENSGSDSNPTSNIPPKFYIILVGNSKYASNELTLTFPDGDAHAMERALKAVSTAWVGAANVHIRTLTTDAVKPADKPDKVNIKAAFDQFAAQAKPTDILIVFFSGHGKTFTAKDASNFYFLTKDFRSWADMDDAGIREKFAISDNELGQWLINNKSLRQVLIFDACNSGKAVENFSGVGARELNASQIVANDMLKDRTGTCILAGSAADKKSFEASTFSQGLLTRSLLEGMNGLALDGDRVDVYRLFDYSCRKVPELAASIKEVQKPVQLIPKGGTFPIGIKDASVSIPLPPSKPLFIRNSFQDSDYGDQLGLNQALEAYFRDMTVKPAEARFCYVSVNEYGNDAYSIRGGYSVEGGTVTAQGFLYKGKTKVGAQKFTVKGQKNNVPELAMDIVAAIWGLVDWPPEK